MNDSDNTTPGVSGTPEPINQGDEQTTPSSEARSADAAPTEEIQGAGAPAEQPTVELPTAHTLPHRTGPTPAHYVTSADQSGQAPQAGAEYATMGQDGYAAQQPQNQYPQGSFGPGQYPQGQYPEGYGYGPAGQNFGGQPPYGQYPQGQYAQAPYGFAAVPPAFQNPKRRPKRWMTLTAAIAAGVIVVGAAGGGAFFIGHATGEQAASAAGQNQTLQIPGSGNGSGGFSGNGFGQGSGGLGGGSSQGGSSQGNGTVPSSATAATAAEKVGLVTIVSTLNYDESSKSAGTGMVMTSDGEILTNNHVVQGATSIQVTVVSTGKTYTADVVGTDATHDVAVLKLQDASGLATVSFDKSASVSTGDAIHSTGNAEGTGSLVTAKGTVSATKQAITVQSESGSGTESLTNLIEISADVVSGDSGGPLRNADGKVIGIVTAASSGTTAVTGYAIPIGDALSISTKILAGESSQYITIGLPAFLGAEIASAGAGTGTGSGTGTGQTAAGVTIAGTVTGSAAAKAGLVAGDTITAIGGTAVADSSALTKAIQSHSVGDSVTVTYTDAAGASHTVTVTLGSGPAA